jgi:L-ascorbate metabolism protein UlaG (beta-lactamase superfamily)
LFWTLTTANTEGAAEDHLGRKNNMKEIKKKIKWLKSNHAYGSACVRIIHDKVIYIDPSNLSSEQTSVKADLILVTHSHDDHFSIKTLRDLQKESTTIITPADCHEELIKSSSNFKLLKLLPGDKTALDGMTIEAVPAYNLESSAHPRSKGWVGYILTIEGVQIYHSGDTSFIPEMKNLTDIDIAIVTVRDHYMMNGKQVVDAITSFRPKVVIPVHWLQPEEPDIQYIQEHAPSGIEVLILEPLH